MSLIFKASMCGWDVYHHNGAMIGHVKDAQSYGVQSSAYIPLIAADFHELTADDLHAIADKIETVDKMRLS